MSIALLKTILAVADRGSFRGAAETVLVSQAAVGQQMKRLEELLQLRLFERAERTPRLTPLSKTLGAHQTLKTINRRKIK